MRKMNCLMLSKRILISPSILPSPHERHKRLWERNLLNERDNLWFGWTKTISEVCMERNLSISIYANKSLKYVFNMKQVNYSFSSKYAQHFPFWDAQHPRRGGTEQADKIWRYPNSRVIKKSTWIIKYLWTFG